MKLQGAATRFGNDPASGKMSAVVADGDGAFVIFEACTAP
jgi:hypothetical protein